jgi:hypothetical protein
MSSGHRSRVSTPSGTGASTAKQTAPAFPDFRKPRLLEAPHRPYLCHLHASQTGGQHVAVLTVNHDDTTQTSHRLHDATLCDPPNPCPCSKTHTSIGGRRDRYILLLSVLFETTPAAPPTMGKSPDGKSMNADAAFCTKVSMCSLSVVGARVAVRKLQHRASPHQWA